MSSCDDKNLYMRTVIGQKKKGSEINIIIAVVFSFFFIRVEIKKVKNKGILFFNLVLCKNYI